MLARIDNASQLIYSFSKNFAASCFLEIVVESPAPPVHERTETTFLFPKFVSILYFKLHRDICIFHWLQKFHVEEVSVESGPPPAV